MIPGLEHIPNLRISKSSNETSSSDIPRAKTPSSRDSRLSSKERYYEEKRNQRSNQMRKLLLNENPNFGSFGYDIVSGSVSQYAQIRAVSTDGRTTTLTFDQVFTFVSSHYGDMGLSVNYIDGCTYVYQGNRFININRVPTDSMLIRFLIQRGPISFMRLFNADDNSSNTRVVTPVNELIKNTLSEHDTESNEHIHSKILKPSLDTSPVDVLENDLQNLTLGETSNFRFNPNANVFIPGM